MRRVSEDEKLDPSRRAEPRAGGRMRRGRPRLARRRVRRRRRVARRSGFASLLARIACDAERAWTHPPTHRRL